MDDSNGSGRDQMLDMFIFESNQLIEQLEEIMLDTEKENELNSDNINEIFRIMHTIKGSSAMMEYNHISKLAHSVEDLFYFIRENNPTNIDISKICDLVLASSDFIKTEVGKVDDGNESDGDETEIEAKIKSYLAEISGKKEEPAAAPKKSEEPQKVVEEAPVQNAAPVPEGDSRYVVKIFFDEGGQMENVRAYTIQRNIAEYTHELYTYPKDLLNAQSEFILENGFILFFATNLDEKHLHPIFEESLFIKSYEINEVESYQNDLVKYNIVEAAPAPAEKTEVKAEPPKVEKATPAPVAPKNDTKLKKAPNSTPQHENKGSKLSLISVNINKLDNLMNLVGELVISESMVTKNPDLKDLQLDNFNKAARQLRKLTDELQDIVMSIRMIPIAGTFQKMQRIVRDMSRKLNKDVEFVTVGEDTEVDKNIIDHLSDPLMHLIRNAMDHGVEPEEERIKAGKAPKARVTLTAHNNGGDIMITVSDDGSGINKEKVIEKAKKNGLLTKAVEDMTDKEIFSLLLLPGFSTNEQVTEYSGRGVGMDVVRQNIEEVGGSISIKSAEGEGSTFTITIPLTLAIADAMEISVGESIYTIPTVAIKESFRAKDEDIFYDNDGNEMIMIRGNVYPIIRLYDIFHIKSDAKSLSDGILIMVEGGDKSACLFADKLLGEQQVVVKPLPKYLVHYAVKDSGIEGCTILGDGSISLILSAKGIISRVIQ